VLLSALGGVAVAGLGLFFSVVTARSGIPRVRRAVLGVLAPDAEATQRDEQNPPTFGEIVARLEGRVHDHEHED
jgi:hypothetical protein